MLNGSQIVSLQKTKGKNKGSFKVSLLQLKSNDSATDSLKRIKLSRGSRQTVVRMFLDCLLSCFSLGGQYRLYWCSSFTHTLPFVLWTISSSHFANRMTISSETRYYYIYTQVDLAKPKIAKSDVNRKTDKSRVCRPLLSLLLTCILLNCSVVH